MNDEVVTTERSVQHNNINILTMHVIQDFYETLRFSAILVPTVVGKTGPEGRYGETKTSTIIRYH